MADKVPPTYTLDDLLTPQAKSALAQWEIMARRTIGGVMHGLHASKRLGVSAEFDHHKNYQPGDPLRHIDWKASARHDRYFVKRYIEESALRVRVVVDHSASMRFATGDGPTKYLQAARLAAQLAYLVIGHGDSVGLTMAAAGNALWLPAGATQRHLVRMLGALAAAAADGTDALPAALAAVVQRGERRGLVALISDLMYDPDGVQRPLAQLLAQGHELLVFVVRDPTEEDFPFNRWVQFGDLENRSVKHRLDALVLKRLYREEYQRLQEGWQAWARKRDVHLVGFRTDQRVDAVLSEYLAFRNGLIG